MRLSRSVPVIVAVWVALVTMGSSVVWGVISAAGQDVVTAEAPIGVATTPVFPEAGTTRTAGEARRPATTSRNTDTARTAAPHPTASAASEDASRAASPSAPPVALPPVSAAVSEPPASQVPTVALRGVRRATWHGPPGLVTAQCVGAAISVVDAEPSDGVGGSEVRAECASGVPSFLAESD